MKTTSTNPYEKEAKLYKKWSTISWIGIIFVIVWVLGLIIASHYVDVTAFPSWAKTTYIGVLIGSAFFGGLTKTKLDKYEDDYWLYQHTKK